MAARPRLHDTDAAATERSDRLRRARDLGRITYDQVRVEVEGAMAAARTRRQPVSFALVRVARDQFPAEATLVDEVSRRLGSAIGPSRVLGCSTPDEVAVLFEGTDAAGAHRMLSEAIAQVLAGTIDLRLWAGLATYPMHAATADELTMAADAALVDAGSDGRGVSIAR